MTLVDPSSRFVLPQESPLPANLGALWAADATLAERMEQILFDEPYPVEPTRSGHTTVAITSDGGKRIYFHSRYAPIDEATRLIDGSNLEDKAVFCVHGMGLGYHVEILLQRIGPEALIVIFEPDLRMLRCAFERCDWSQWIESGRLMFVCNDDRSSLMSRLGQQQAMVSVGLTFITHAPSVQLHPKFHDQMQRLMGEFVAFCRTSLNTLVINGRRTCENLARNVGWYVKAPPINDLHRLHQGRPAIIVSAGPSLRRNKHLLAEARGRAVLVAVQTTLLPLLELGVEPDFVTTLDYHEISTRFYEKLPRTLKTQLVADPKASSAVLSLFPGIVRILGNDYADKLLAELRLNKDRLRNGATVAHLAFYLAEYMGCDPIIFVGQDLGFGDGLCYAPGTSYEDVWRPELGRFCTMEMKQWEHIARERPILRQIPDQQGRPMYTEERLFAYLQQFEQDFAASRSRIIDATEGGAMKRGARIMTLREALDQFCCKPIETGESPRLAYANQRVALASHSLRNRGNEARRIEDLARQTLPMLEEVRDHLDQQERVNRLIAKIDALRAQMNELNNCYELVTQLSQQTELARFHSDRRIAASGASGLELQRKQVQRDILNVTGVADAAREFQQLMHDCAQQLESEAG